MNTQKQVASFIIVGGVNTVFGYSLYVIFIFIGLSYPIAVFLSTCLGVLFNFKTTGKIVFGNTNNQSFLKFSAVYATIYLFKVMLIQLMQIWTSNLYLAGFLAMIPAAIIAFILNKYFVFREVYEIN